MSKKELPSEKIQHALCQLVDYYDKEDIAVRQWQIRKWRKYKLYWEGFQRIYQDTDIAHDWRIYDAEAEADTSDAVYYDKPVNIFRAYLESIIAALSVTVPGIKCAPDDADNVLDIETSRAGDKIAELIFKHNNAPLLWLHALYTFVTEGMIACYSYPKEDEKYGTYEDKEYKDEAVERYQCPNCNENLGDDLSYFAQTPMMEQSAQPTMEDDMGGMAQPEPMMDMSLLDQELAMQDEQMQDEFQPSYVCPSCNGALDPMMQKTPLIITRLVGVTNKPKTRICQEIYGGLYVKVPNYARQQKDIPYLGFSYECHISEVLCRYTHLREKFLTKNQTPSVGSQGSDEYYERWGRLSPQYRGEYPIDTPTVRNFWFRPFSYHILDEECVDDLKEKYPDGVKVVLINQEFAEAIPEVLDDCWTLTYNPLADNIHFEPLGQSLISIQDITNDLVSLTLQTIEHGIPQIFVDPQFVDAKAYKNQEVMPGALTFTKTLGSGRSVSDGFYEAKTATLSQEVMPFGQQIQGLGQLVSGATAEIFGGGNIEGSKTASEYSMRRSQSLQRLQNTWKILLFWWKDVYGKCIPAYMKEIVEDERFTKKDQQGNYINIFIRRAELQGKIGEVELEATEQLPIMWGQKKDVVMKLMEMQNPVILESMGSPENLPLLKTALGLDEFKVPGQMDREKCIEDIKLLLNSEPIALPVDEMMVMEAIGQGVPPEEAMQPQFVPSLEIDPDLDNPAIIGEVCRTYLISEAGRLAKIENASGYKNVLLYMKQAKMLLQQQMMEQAMAAIPPEDSGNNQKSGKVTEENKDERVNV